MQHRGDEAGITAHEIRDLVAKIGGALDDTLAWLERGRSGR
ncbi:hypothetical protein [Azospirillum endophyticum]